jgi:hypothetical protein
METHMSSQWSGFSLFGRIVGRQHDVIRCAAPPVVALSLGLLAASCANLAPQSAQATPSPILYAISGPDLYSNRGGVNAGAYCRQFGLVPQLLDVQPGGNTGRIIYACVPLTN